MRRIFVSNKGLEMRLRWENISTITQKVPLNAMFKESVVVELYFLLLEPTNAPANNPLGMTTKETNVPRKKNCARQRGGQFDTVQSNVIYKHEKESTSNFETAVPLQKNRANLSWDFFTFERRRWVAHSSFRIKTSP